MRMVSRRAARLAEVYGKERDTDSIQDLQSTERSPVSRSATVASTIALVHHSGAVSFNQRSSVSQLPSSQRSPASPQPSSAGLPLRILANCCSIDRDHLGVIVHSASGAARLRDSYLPIGVLATPEWLAADRRGSGRIVVGTRGRHHGFCRVTQRPVRRGSSAVHGRDAQGRSSWTLSPEQARIAEGAGAVAVMALESGALPISAPRQVRMSDPDMGRSPSW